jgi:hypothetical protein
MSCDSDQTLILAFSLEGEGTGLGGRRDRTWREKGPDLEGEGSGLGGERSGLKMETA